MKKNEILLNLAKNVILPTIKITTEKLDMPPKKALGLVKKLNITRVAVIPFSKHINEDEIIKSFFYLEEIYKIGLDRKDVIIILNDFYSSLKKIMEKYGVKNIELFDMMFEALINYHNDEKMLESYKDNFFEFDTEQDENIKKMHYTQEQKINAKEFLKIEIGIDEVIDELEDILDEFYNTKFDDLNENYLEHLKKVIEEFVHIFKYSIEFKDLAYGLKNLLIILDKKNLLDSPNKELIKLLIDSVIDDLNKFYYAVFVNQDAVDIHYLDASLLANIAQIELVLKS